MTKPYIKFLSVACLGGVCIGALAFVGVLTNAEEAVPGNGTDPEYKGFVTAGDLRRDACQSTEKPMLAWCIGYLTGVAEYTNVLNRARYGTNCWSPGKGDPSMFRRNFLRLTTDNTLFDEIPAAAAAAMAIEATYDCPSMIKKQRPK